MRMQREREEEFFMGARAGGCKFGEAEGFCQAGEGWQEIRKR